MSEEAMERILIKRNAVLELERLWKLNPPKEEQPIKGENK